MTMMQQGVLLTKAEQMDELGIGRSVIDKQGDPWTKLPDGRWSSPETASFDSCTIIRKWGPVRLVETAGADTQALTTEQVRSLMRSVCASCSVGWGAGGPRLTTRTTPLLFERLRSSLPTSVTDEQIADLLSQAAATGHKARRDRQRLVLARRLLAARCGAEHVAFYENAERDRPEQGPSPMWLEALETASEVLDELESVFEHDDQSPEA